MTVRQLLAEADSYELTQWAAFYLWEHQQEAEARKQGRLGYRSP